MLFHQSQVLGVSENRVLADIPIFSMPLNMGYTRFSDIPTMMLSNCDWKPDIGKNHGFNCKLSHQSIRLFVHLWIHFWLVSHESQGISQSETATKHVRNLDGKSQRFRLDSGQWIDFFTQRIVLLDTLWL